MRKTNDVTIWDETSSNSATVDSEGELNSKSKIWDGTNSVTISSNRLDINALQDGNWSIVDITGTISLPTGAATESTLDAFKVANEASLTAIETDVESVDTNLQSFAAQNTADLQSIEDNQTDGTQRTKITDGTDDAEVTMNGRLKVETTISAVPATPVRYGLFKLLNGTSPSQAVDGSVTPVIFEWAPGTDEVWYVERINFVFSDTGQADPDGYGSGNGLTNGINLQIQSNGEVGSGQILKTNIDLVELFNNDSFSSNSTFLGTKSSYKGSIHFDNAFVISNITSDYVRVTINDDLTGIDFQEVSVLVWREIN